MILILGLIVAFRFSPAAVLLHAARAMQAAYAERQRLDELTRPSPASLPRAESGKLAQLAESSIEPLAEPAVQAPEWPMLVDNSAPPEALELEEVEEIPLKPAWVEEPAAAPGEPGSFVTLDEGREIEEWIGIEWKLPPLTLLDPIIVKRERMEDEIKRNVRIIESTLQTFGVQARVIGVNSGPAVTQYQLQPAAGVAVKKIVALQNDLALALAASPLRIEAPIPGKSAVGVEVPNKSATPVSLREVVESPSFSGGGQALAVALGNDVTGQPITSDLSRMPHLLIAGATGQGKSVCINALLCSLLMHSRPTELRLVMIDPKRVELNLYNDLP
ncbi:MAG: DNA translocase FtsK, partial [Candidatus Dormibacteraceae bacterium]